MTKRALEYIEGIVFRLRLYSGERANFPVQDLGKRAIELAQGLESQTKGRWGKGAIAKTNLMNRALAACEILTGVKIEPSQLPEWKSSTPLVAEAPEPELDNRAQAALATHEPKIIALTLDALVGKSIADLKTLLMPIKGSNF
ncbi:MAG: hypothetical protein HY537_16555 [Deltaproteobacteria bacterium]|nr:hypothetical protein [Deltaproteobacteria bacterium]